MWRPGSIQVCSPHLDTLTVATEASPAPAPLPSGLALAPSSAGCSCANEGLVVRGWGQVPMKNHDFSFSFPGNHYVSLPCNDFILVFEQLLLLSFVMAPSNKSGNSRGDLSSTHPSACTARPSSRLLPQGLAFVQPSKKESQLGLRDVQPVSSRVKKSKICFYLSESLSPNQGSSICTSCPEPGRQLFQGFLSPKLHLIKF